MPKNAPLSRPRKTSKPDVPPNLFSGGPTTADDVRWIVNKMWETTHSEQSRDAMLGDLSFLAGVSCAVLMDYARLLEDSAKSSTG